MLQELGRRMLDPDEVAIEQTQATLSKFWAKEIDGKLKLKRLVRSQVLQAGAGSLSGSGQRRALGSLALSGHLV